MVASLFENVACFWENSRRASQDKDERKFLHGIDFATTLLHRGMKRSGRAPMLNRGPGRRGKKRLNHPMRPNPDLGFASGFFTRSGHVQKKILGECVFFKKHVAA
jgi:hypothetical protein